MKQQAKDRKQPNAFNRHYSYCFIVSDSTNQFSVAKT